MLVPDFCALIEGLGINSLSKHDIKRVASFLCHGTGSRAIIYVNTLLHHLRRVGNRSFHSSVNKEELIAAICAKLLHDEQLLRDICFEIGEFRELTEPERFLENSDLRAVLWRYSVR